MEWPQPSASLGMPEMIARLPPRDLATWIKGPIIAAAESPLTSTRVQHPILVLYQGCTCRGWPRQFGNCHRIYECLSLWTKAGVLERMAAEP